MPDGNGCHSSPTLTIMNRLLVLLLLFPFAAACQPPDRPAGEDGPDAISLDGRELYAPEPDSALLARYEARKRDYEVHPANAQSLIWYGRFSAYIGNYAQAIDLFTEGIERFPEDPRFYRHRGHRYITIRQFDRAIVDLERAADLIEGTENTVEPDGMPNAQGIPVSTLHGNIWYHLGLAYYLKQDMPSALRAYEHSLAAGDYPDNVVSNTHWLYMIHRRMGNEEAAEAVLEPITADMKIIENHAYHQLTLFYKGLLSESDLAGNGSAGDAISYGIANWHFYSHDTERSRTLLRDLLDNGMWASFGYIAAESDWVHNVENE